MAEVIMTAAAFKEWRRRMGYRSMAAAGRALGVHPKTVWNYENGAQVIPKPIRLACCAMITLGVADYPGPEKPKADRSDS